MARPVKPLGAKAYGSIPHLPGSRTGSGDWSIHEGQARICLERARAASDRIIVTEKLDGSCVAVARIGENLVPLIRAGYCASDSPYEQHHAFAAWVVENASRFKPLRDGERVVGEWIYQAHGTLYGSNGEPFIPFDLMSGKNRAPHDAAQNAFGLMALRAAAVISDGGPCSIEAAMRGLGSYGHHNAREPAEGAVWRVERDGYFDFMAKYVRPEKVDGKYLPGLCGNSNDAPPIVLFSVESEATS